MHKVTLNHIVLKYLKDFFFVFPKSQLFNKIGNEIQLNRFNNACYCFSYLNFNHTKIPTVNTDGSLTFSLAHSVQPHI